MRRKENIQRIQKHGPPKVYLTRLESDFSFLGDFDLCVSTFTLHYVKNVTDVVARISARVRLGGSLILQYDISRANEILNILKGEYDDIRVTYWGRPHCHIYPDDQSVEHLVALVREELAIPNFPEGHTQVYICARGKKNPPSRSNAMPDIIDEGNGLFIVNRDAPLLGLN